MEGTPLDEYPGSNDDIEHKDPLVRAHKSSCTVTNYIECATGKYFDIRLTVGSENKFDCPRLGFYIYVDGIFTIGKCPRRHGYKNKDWTILVKGIQSGTPGIIRQLKFSEIPY